MNSTNSGRLVRSSEGTSKLFVYGTLLLDDVVSALIDRVPRRKDAIAPGWWVARLPHKVYPGLVSGQGEAKGKVFTDLTEAEWAILDAFEDPVYTLAAVQVMVPVETEAFTCIRDGQHVDQGWSIVALVAMNSPITSIAADDGDDSTGSAVNSPLLRDKNAFKLRDSCVLITILAVTVSSSSCRRLAEHCPPVL